MEGLPDCRDRQPLPQGGKHLFPRNPGVVGVKVEHTAGKPAAGTPEHILAQVDVQVPAFGLVVAAGAGDVVADFPGGRGGQPKQGGHVAHVERFHSLSFPGLLCLSGSLLQGIVAQVFGCRRDVLVPCKLVGHPQDGLGIQGEHFPQCLAAVLGDGARGALGLAKLFLRGGFPDFMGGFGLRIPLGLSPSSSGASAKKASPAA